MYVDYNSAILPQHKNDVIDRRKKKYKLTTRRDSSLYIFNSTPLFWCGRFCLHSLSFAIVCTHGTLQHSNENECERSVKYTRTQWDLLKCSNVHTPRMENGVANVWRMENSWRFFADFPSEHLINESFLWTLKQALHLPPATINLHHIFTYSKAHKDMQKLTACKWGFENLMKTAKRQMGKLRTFADVEVITWNDPSSVINW